MARLVVAHRFEHRDVGPLAAGRCAVLLQHPSHCLAQAAQLVRFGANHVARHDRRGCLTERAGLYVMGEVGDGITLHLEVDGHGRAAELGMSGRRRVGVAEPAQPRNIPGELKDAAIVDLVQHHVWRCFAGRKPDCAGPVNEYIWCLPPAREGDLRPGREASLWREAGCGSHVNGNAASGRHALGVPPRVADAAAPVTPPASKAGRTERPRWTLSSSLGPKLLRLTSRPCPNTYARHPSRSCPSRPARTRWRRCVRSSPMPVTIPTARALSTRRSA